MKIWRLRRMINLTTIQGLYYYVNTFKEGQIKFDMLQGLKKEMEKEKYRNKKGCYMIFEEDGELMIITHSMRSESFDRLVNSHNNCVYIDFNGIHLKQNNRIDTYRILSYDDTFTFLLNKIDREELTYNYRVELSKIIEPHVCASSKRFEAIKILSDNGIFTGIMMNPVLPFITDNEEDIKKLVKMAYESGAKFIHTYMGMTLRENQRDYYFEQLDKHFKGLKDKYINYYGERYNCSVPNYKRLYKVFTSECDKYGILYDMKDIIKAYKREIKDNEQISLF